MEKNNTQKSHVTNIEMTMIILGYRMWSIQCQMQNSKVKMSEMHLRHNCKIQEINVYQSKQYQTGCALILNMSI